MSKTFICAEIGINHNGDIRLAKQLIDLAVEAGCDAVKFQKRTIDKVYTKEFLDSPRQSPWGDTQRAQKEGLEFNIDQYKEIDSYCKSKGIEWYVSAWDLDSQRFMKQFDVKYNKIASAMLINDEILEESAKQGRYTFIATGMSTYEEIDHAVDIFKKYNCPYELMHCVSAYPMKPEDANLNMINKLKEKYGVNVGYSGHELDEITSAAAVAIGATSIERHITLDRTMYGSDQKVSIEPDELKEMVKNIRIVEAAMGSGEKILSEAEMETKLKLRG